LSSGVPNYTQDYLTSGGGRRSRKQYNYREKKQSKVNRLKRKGTKMKQRRRRRSIMKKNRYRLKK